MEKNMQVRLKAFLGLIIVMTLAFIVGKAYLSPHYQKKITPVVKIGVSLPLTGEYAPIGIAMKGALEVFQADMATRPLKNKYEFVIEDNASDAVTATNVNTKFVKLDKVKAILDFSSEYGKLTALTATRDKVLHMNVCASDTAIADGIYNFVHSTAPQDEAALLADTLKDNYQNVSIIYTNEAGYVEMADALFDALAKHKMTVNMIVIQPHETDIGGIIDKSALYLPEIYIAAIKSPELESVLKTIRDKEIITPITSNHTLENLHDLSLAEGVQFVTFGQASQELEQKIAAQNQNKTDTTICTGNIYDAARLLIDAFENSWATEGAAMYLSGIKEWNGSMGKVANRGHGVFSVPAIKAAVKDGVIVHEK